MNQGLFGAISSLAGVAMGSALAWLREALAHRTMRERSARYLAIRVICLLDKYVEACASVATDDGLDHGQPDEEGCRSPQVQAPEAPAFPGDLDWRSIDHSLAYRLLSMPNAAEAAEHSISVASEYQAGPPDYEEYFEERQDQYAMLGLAAHALTEELRNRYGIPQLDIQVWNPVEQMREARQQVEEARRKRKERLLASPTLSGLR